MVVLDAEVSNSTRAELFQKAYPDRFFEMYIAEQNMVGAAVGLSSRGKIPFVSTFAAFFTRAHDQIRMAAYSQANIKFVGSHAGVFIGQDGPSQMGLEDIALFRSIMNSVVLYPADALSCEKIVEEAAKQQGIVYVRTTRKETPVIYDTDETFPIGGSKIHKRESSGKPAKVAIVAAGITLFEALKVQGELLKEGIGTIVIDCYSIKPLDVQMLQTVASQVQTIVTVEDHYPAGGIGEAVMSALADCPIKIVQLAVNKMPKSGKPEELLRFEQISAEAICKTIKELAM